MRVASGGAHLRALRLATQLRRNVAAVASRWRHCVLFDKDPNPRPLAPVAIFLPTALIVRH